MIDSVLRPMSTSQVLDRTFNFYRNNFQLFAGISIFPALLGSAYQLVLLQFNLMPVFAPGKALDPSDPYLFLGIYTMVFPIYLLGHALASGATIHVVSHFHLETRTTIGESYQTTLQSFGRIFSIVLSTYFLFLGALLLTVVEIILLVGIGVAVFTVMTSGAGGLGGGSIAIAIVLGILGVGLFVAGLRFSVRLYLRFSLAVPVCLVEKHAVAASLKRSWFLAQGAVNRIFLIYLLMAVLGAALSWTLQIPSLILAARHPDLFSNIWSVSATFAATTLVSPVASIAVALVYYDQRVRKEAFDLQLMVESIGQSAPGQAAAAFPGIV